MPDGASPRLSQPRHEKGRVDREYFAQAIGLIRRFDSVQVQQNGLADLAQRGEDAAIVLKISRTDADQHNVHKPAPIRFPVAALLISCAFFPVSTRAAGNPGARSMPLVFVENRGQAAARIRYIGAGPEFKAWFEDRGVTLQQGQTAIRISFERSAKPRIEADDPIGARANYLHGNDPRRWQTDLPLFATIRYSGLWPGIELRYTAERSRLKAEYVVAPGATRAGSC